MPAFYAVAKGFKVGIFSTWEECHKHVKHFKGPIYKKFSTLAEAEGFIRLNSQDKNFSVGSESGENHPVVSSQNLSSPNHSDMGSALRHAGTKVTSFQGAASVGFRTFDAKRELHLAKTDLIQLKERLIPSSPDSRPTFNKVEARIDRVLAFLANNNGVVKREAEDVVVHDVEEPIPLPQGPKRSKKEDRQLKEGMGKKTKLNEFGLHTDSDGFVHVYTDGACSANGRACSKAGIGVWWSDGHALNLSEPVVGTKATNNTAEIQAAIRAIEIAKENSIKKLWIQTDSMFMINCMTKWIDAWKRNGWVTSKSEPVLNKDDLQRLDGLLNEDRDFVVRWGYVTAHRGIHGNEAADELARAGAQEYRRS